jgi:flavocytochrome c
MSSQYCWSMKVLFGLALLPLFWIHVILSGSYLAIHSPRQGSSIDDATNIDTTSTVRHESLRHPSHHVKLRRSHFDVDDSIVDYLLREPPMADAIVVGSGLAGLTATLTILDRGGTVVLLEKESILGGNSNKASSGINACCLEQDRERHHNNDTLALFRDDTVRSAGDGADLPLIDTLVGESATAVEWLQERVGVDLSALVQLGGHSRRRTHRPQRGFVGAEIINAMETAIRAYEPTGKVSIRVDTQVQRIIRLENDDDDDGKVLGVVSESLHGEYGRLRADHVILATGGFASDRTRGSYLEKFRPELLSFPATAGAFSTGDGIAMAEAIGASSRDMDKIQLHPTGFVNPTDRSDPNKVLAAEILRGVGGILLNHDGERFCNELGTRSYVTDRMLDENSRYAASKRWNRRSEIPTFYLVLTQAAAQLASRHVGVYKKKGLLKKVEGIENLARELKVSTTRIRKTLERYNMDALSGADEFGKTVFENLPLTMVTPQTADYGDDGDDKLRVDDEDDEVFFVGEVTPVLHYCMGGLTIDPEGNVMTGDGTLIPGLHAAGEVSGGVHGDNRLGGNSLLECAVFGGVVGRNIPITKTIQSLSIYQKANEDVADHEDRHSPLIPTHIITMEELSQHKSMDDCWVGLQGQVYDLSRFAQHHPGGSRSIHSLAGTDATHIFSKIHSDHLLDRIQKDRVGTLKVSGTRDAVDFDDAVDVNNGDLSSTPPSVLRDVSQTELERHNRPDDCWVVLHGMVYDLTDFLPVHPGGAYMIEKHAGKDGTLPFQVLHRDTTKFDGMLRQFAVGHLVAAGSI